MSKVGLVIPVYKTDYVIDCVNSLKSADAFQDLVVCIVNDGQDSVKQYLSKKEFPENVSVLHLPQNVQFAAANNAGWDFILQHHPDIEFLGSINDDTIVRDHWLTAMVTSLENDSEIGMVAPVMESPLPNGKIRVCHSFKLNTSNKPLLPDGDVVDMKFVTAISGFCFIVRRQLLQKIEFFDPNYRNSCEDIDLCIKVQQKGYKIALLDKSRVLHLEESSRFDEGANTSTGHARRRLRLKWGKNLTGKKSILDYIVNFFVRLFIDR